MPKKTDNTEKQHKFPDLNCRCQDKSQKKIQGKMVDSIINSAVDIADIVLLGANYDKTSSFGKGADKGPKKIRKYLDRQIELYERFSETSPTDIAKIAFEDLGNLNNLRPEHAIDCIRNYYLKLLQKNKFIIMIGGEHSVTNGAAEALAANLHPRELSDITVVQLDAHFDLRNNDSDYTDKPHGKYAHSAVMRRCHELGFKLVQAGIRTYSEDELDYATKNSRSITFFEWGKNKKQGSTSLFMPPSIDEILSSIKTDQVYLSIDVDGFDPSDMPETGTPVPGGFSWDYGVKLVNTIMLRRSVIGADVVEVAPQGKVSRTAYNGAQLVYNIIAHHLAAK